MNNITVEPTHSHLLDYERITAAIHYLEEHLQEQPTLDQLANYLHLSPFHTQRLFKRWAGISPKRLSQFLTLTYAQQLLRETRSTLDATYEVGLSSPSRLHDLFVTIDAVTPAEYKKMGEGVVIRYGYQETPFGEALVAVTDRGVCGLHFIVNDRQTAFDELTHNWPRATFFEDQTAVATTTRQIFERAYGEKPPHIRLFLKGTNFQLKVWEALLKIPVGSVAAYGDIASLIGQPSASRAVGSAIGRNAIAYLIPCHRVIRNSGAINAYRWGNARKKALFVWEQGTKEGEREKA